MKCAVFLFVAAALSIPVFAQSGGKAELFSAAQIRERVAALTPQAAASGSAGQMLADYGSHKVQISVRTASGGAEIHAHFDDVIGATGHDSVDRSDIGIIAAPGERDVLVARQHIVGGI
jgi:hypothetical protein